MAYDPARISLDELLEAFWTHHNPTGSAKGQYRSVIFYTTEAQRSAAEASKAERQSRMKRQLSTKIEPAQPFWRAEEYHQRFSEKKLGTRR